MMRWQRVLTILTGIMLILFLMLTWWTCSTAWKFKEASWKLGYFDSTALFFKAGLLLGVVIFLIVILWRKLFPLQGCFLVTMAFLLLFGEIGIRLMKFMPVLYVDQYHAVPYIMYTTPPGEGEVYTTTELGYRDDVPMPKPEGEYRIIVIGGSTVLDYRIADRADTLVGQLDELLGPNVQTYNWGVKGAVTEQALVTVLMRAVEYDPDMIITYDGINNLYLSYFYDPRPGYTRNFMANEAGLRVVGGRFGVFDLVALLMNKSRLGRLVFYPEIAEQLLRWTDLLEVANFDTDEWRVELAATYEDSVRKTCMLSEAFDFEYVAFLQPMIFFKNHISGEEEISTHYADEIVSHTQATYILAREAYQALSAEYPECGFYDVSSVFQNNSDTLFLDNMHLNGEGNRIMAETLMPYIEAHIGEE